MRTRRLVAARAAGGAALVPRGAAGGCAALPAPPDARRPQVVTVLLPAAVRRPARRRRPRAGRRPDPARPEPHDLELTVAADRARSPTPTWWSTRRASRPPSTTRSTRAARRTSSTPPTSAPSRDLSGATDPHFWLDPLRLADGRPTPWRDAARGGRPGARAATTARNAARAARATSTALDRGVPPRAGALPSATRSWSATTRSATSAPLRARRGRPITGLSPDAEPSPADLAAAAGPDPADGITTVFSERLGQPASWPTASPATWASRTAVLDPIEGLSDATADQDYLSLMRDNLARPREGERMPVTDPDGTDRRRSSRDGAVEHRRPADPARHRPDRRAGRGRSR